MKLDTKRENRVKRRAVDLISVLDFIIEIFVSTSLTPPANSSGLQADRCNAEPWVYILRRDLALKRKSRVKLDRMKPADAGLRAVTDLWIGTYQKVIESGGFTSQALRRIDPNPRLAILIEYGVLTGEQQAVIALRTSFERAAAATE